MVYAYIFGLRIYRFLFLNYGKCTFDISCKVYSSPLATRLRFDNESLSFALLLALVIGLKIGVVCGETPSNGEKFVLGGEFFPKSHQAFPQTILSGENGHS